MPMAASPARHAPGAVPGAARRCAPQGLVGDPSPDRARLRTTAEEGRDTRAGTIARWTWPAAVARGPKQPQPAADVASHRQGASKLPAAPNFEERPSPATGARAEAGAARAGLPGVSEQHAWDVGLHSQRGASAKPAGRARALRVAGEHNPDTRPVAPHRWGCHQTIISFKPRPETTSIPDSSSAGTTRC